MKTRHTSNMIFYKPVWLVAWNPWKLWWVFGKTRHTFGSGRLSRIVMGPGSFRLARNHGFANSRIMGFPENPSHSQIRFARNFDLQTSGHFIWNSYSILAFSSGWYWGHYQLVSYRQVIGCPHCRPSIHICSLNPLSCLTWGTWTKIWYAVAGQPIRKWIGAGSHSFWRQGRDYQ